MADQTATVQTNIVNKASRGTIRPESHHGTSGTREVDASSASFDDGELTDIWTPMLVGEPPPAFRSVKLAKLLLGILDGFARQAFVHWVARTDADSSAEATPSGSFR